MNYAKATAELRTLRRAFRDWRIDNGTADEDDLRVAMIEDMSEKAMIWLWSGNPKHREGYGRGLYSQMRTVNVQLDWSELQ